MGFIGPRGPCRGRDRCISSLRAFPLSQIDQACFGNQRHPFDVGLVSFRLSFLEAQMGKKLYVGNLTYGVTDSSLQQLLAAHGTVQSAQVIMDRDTGRSKGFGFVEMASDRPGLRFDDPLLSLC